VSLAGYWGGEYVYGPGIGADAPPSVRFDLVVSWGFWGRVTGRIQDRGEGDRTAKVCGRYQGHRLMFYKTYPGFSVLDEDGALVEFGRYMREVEGIEIFRMPRHVVRYEALWDEDAQHYRGIWQLANQIVPSSVGPIETGSGEGTFRMWRTSWDVPRPF